MLTRGASSLLSMSNDEEPAPSAAVLENEDDEAGSDAEQASRAQKRRKTGLTKVVCRFTVAVKNKLNLCGVLTFEVVCVHV